MEQAKECLAAPPSRPSSTPPQPRLFRLGVVIGHNERARGAYSKLLGASEFGFNSRLAEQIQKHALSRPQDEIEVSIFRREPGRSYAQQIDHVYRETDRWGAHATIELHFNSAGGSATGTETLYSGSLKGLALAEPIQKKMCSLLGLRDRGVRARARRQRGGRSLHAGRAPAALVEPFFGSGAGDVARVLSVGMEALALAILEGARLAALNIGGR